MNTWRTVDEQPGFMISSPKFTKEFDEHLKNCWWTVCVHDQFSKIHERVWWILEELLMNNLGSWSVLQNSWKSLMNFYWIYHELFAFMIISSKFMKLFEELFKNLSRTDEFMNCSQKVHEETQELLKKVHELLNILESSTKVHELTCGLFMNSSSWTGNENFWWMFMNVLELFKNVHQVMNWYSQGLSDSHGVVSWLFEYFHECQSRERHLDVRVSGLCFQCQR